jgi:hypothetical protein
MTIPRWVCAFLAAFHSKRAELCREQSNLFIAQSIKHEHRANHWKFRAG